ncbi:MAG: pirin family protein [Coriobacteriales bacterium]|jgi:redox-sensitive bicupin YhaK (pirin superfamily)|nr:pirin family protein [Coriobacteriales bacterium]
MLRAIDSKAMGRGMHGWLDSHFHFSFSEYYNPENIDFGVLRVLNDDIVLPGTGFENHPHQNMEIVSYVLEGELTHGDNMGNEQTISRGHAQYMSAGTGVWHSEMNNGTLPLRFFQIWIFADKDGYEPNYGDHRFAWEDRINVWMPMATSINNATNTAPIKMHQDINMYASYLSAGKSLPFTVSVGRQAYLALAEGKIRVNGIGLHERDALEIVEEDIVIDALEDAHIVVIEMPKA